MNHDDYVTESVSQLNNTGFYRKVDHHLTVEHNDHINERLLHYKNAGEISEKNIRVPKE